MSVSLYDLLDVDERASADEIRAAWKSAIAELDPTDRRFRAYNDAAAVLLDEEKRAAYDAELAAARGDDTTTDTPADPAEPIEVAEDPAPTAVAPVEEPSDHHHDASDDEPDEEPAPATTPARATTAASEGPPTWALAVATVAAVLALAFMLTVLLVWPGGLGGTSPAEREDQAAEIEQAGAEAESFAAEAIPVVLSYDYRTLEADFAEAEGYLTDDFATQRTDLFAQRTEAGITLREQIVRDKVVVTAREAGTGLTRVSDDGERATVVVFVDQDSQHGNAAPRALRMWATLDVVKTDGEWLLDDICTESDCS